MKSIRAIVIAAQFCAFSAFAQPFQNLDFEAANLPVIPAGQYGGLVPIAEGLPGWSGLEGTNPVSQVLQNNATLGNPSIDILGPSWRSSQGPAGFVVIGGNYSVVIQSGLEESIGQQVPATIYQTGTIPSTAKSLQFDAAGDILGYLAVTFDGKSIPFSILSTSPSYQTYGADISELAGQTGQLNFSEIPGHPYYEYATLDDIIFSPELIPEPSTWALLLCGAAWLGVAQCKPGQVVGRRNNLHSQNRVQRRGRVWRRVAL